jgi:hypothetical protein
MPEVQAADRKAHREAFVAKHPGLARLVDVPDAGGALTINDLRQFLPYGAPTWEPQRACAPEVQAANDAARRLLSDAPTKEPQRACAGCGSPDVPEQPTFPCNGFDVWWCDRCVAEEMKAHDLTAAIERESQPPTPTFPHARRYCRCTGDIGGGPEIG